ncbi:hypothetical protein JW711_03320 [Candidatus Woesearchaeota archaeon]|nr:hypothetical protein [Candidatus Woesearchaeota archaeon]
MMNRKIIALVFLLIMVIGGLLFFQFLKQKSQPIFVEGEETLEVMMLRPDNSPMQDLEIDLWVANNPDGPPTAGYSRTDEEGKAVFKIPAGDYLIGFNSYGFPEEFLIPEKISTTVKTGENQETIVLQSIN